MATTKTTATTADPADKTAEKTKETDAPVNTALEPYPTGNPADPEDAFEAAHGFRRAKE